MGYIRRGASLWIKQVFWFSLGIGLSLGILMSGAKADEVGQVLNCAGDPCVVKLNLGGSVLRFEQTASAINLGARSKVIIDGRCYSACTIAIDELPPEKVCLTEQARLFFHKGRGKILWSDYPGWLWPPVTVGFDPDAYVTPNYSPTVKSWIDSIGGLPPKGEFVEMPYATARSIWPRCEAAVPLPRPRPARFITALNAHQLY